MAADASDGAAPPPLLERLRSFIYLFVWFWISTLMVMYNKYIFQTLKFPFPIALCLAHMVFCSSLAAVAIRVLKVTERKDMSFDDFLRRIAPIGFFFALGLYCNQSAYVHLSVSFVQMVKTALPGVTFFTSMAFGVLKWDPRLFASIIIIVGGVTACSHGELAFSTIGLVFQLVGLIVESIRLVMSEKLLKGVGLSLNSIQMLYYVAPVSGACLVIPFVLLELPALQWQLGASGKGTDMTVLHLAGNCAVAFSLNMASFLLIGHTSALTMNVAGIVKDCLMIYLSFIVFHSPVTATQVAGFAVSAGGVKLYNKRKGEIARVEAAAAGEQPPKQSPAVVDRPEAPGDTPGMVIGDPVDRVGGSAAKRSSSQVPGGSAKRSGSQLPPMPEDGRE